MGQWGFYDDEGDIVSDSAYIVEKILLPKHLQRCYRFDKVIKVNCNDLRNKKKREELINKLKKEIGGDKNISTFISKSCKIIGSTDKSIKCYINAHEYILKNQNKIPDIIKNKWSGNDRIIAGLALYLARGWNSTPIFPKNMKTVNRGFALPKYLPKDFPMSLKKMAFESSVKQLREFDNKDDWSEPKKRLQALKNQIKLFS